MYNNIISWSEALSMPVLPTTSYNVHFKECKVTGLINIGFGNIINADKIVAMVTPDSAPSKRLVQTSRENGSVVDATQGRRTRAIIVMDSGHIVLSSLLPDTIAGRFNSAVSETKFGSKLTNDSIAQNNKHGL